MTLKTTPAVSFMMYVRNLLHKADEELSVAGSTPRFEAAYEQAINSLSGCVALDSDLVMINPATTPGAILAHIVADLEHKKKTEELETVLRCAKKWRRFARSCGVIEAGLTHNPDTLFDEVIKRASAKHA